MKKNVMYLLSVIILTTCSGSNDESSTPDPTGNNGNSGSSNPQAWLIPISEVKDGGPGKGGIPSIDNPIFINASSQTFLSDNDLVIGIVKNNEVKAYPLSILNWHEITNDDLNGELVTINFCPLTGTSFGWKSISNGTTTTFGVSGLLYNANLILYDRNTDSYWSQIKLQCISGDLIRDEPTLINVVETNWLTWKTLYPNTKVLSTDTGFSRNYGINPYSDYLASDNSFLFPFSPLNEALPFKERVYGIIDEGISKAYQFTNFVNGKVIQESFNGKDYLVVGNKNLIQAFQLTGDYLNLTFEYDFTGSEGFFKDNEANIWSVFGEAISGSRMGETLTPAKSVVSYWFALAAFYPNPEIYSE